MADYKEQRQLARNNSGFRQAKLKSDYDAYLAQLATQYGQATKDLDSNLESRGILNSGEAGTARTTGAATNEAATTKAKSDFDYNTGIEGINLTQELATLQTNKATPEVTPVATPVATPAAAAPVKEVKTQIDLAPTKIGGGKTFASTGLYGVVTPAPGTVKPKPKPKLPIYDSRPNMPKPKPKPKPTTTTIKPVGPRLR